MPTSQPHFFFLATEAAREVQAMLQGDMLQGSAMLQGGRRGWVASALGGWAGPTLWAGNLPLGVPPAGARPSCPLHSPRGTPQPQPQPLSPLPWAPRCPLVCSPGEEAPAGPAGQPVRVQNPAAQLHSETGRNSEPSGLAH